MAVGAGIGTRSALDVLRSKGIYREATDLPVIDDEDDKPHFKGATGPAGGKAIAAVQEGLKAEISQLEAQVADLEHEREQLRGQVDHLRNALDQERKKKASAAGGATATGPSQTVVDIIAAMEDRDWVGSALSYYNRDFDRVKTENDEYQMGEFIKLMLRTQVKETTALLEQLQGEIDGYKEQLSFRDKKITDMGSELALARGRKEAVPAPSGGGADAGVVRDLRSKVADLERVIDDVADDKMRMMTIFTNELDELRSELKRMGRMQRSCQTMGVAVFRAD
jgi:predicted  nucleic acid-binding Zn-ribbon protein